MSSRSEISIVLSVTHGASSHTGRRTMTIHQVVQNVEGENIQLLLDDSELNHCEGHMNVDNEDLGKP